jgi:hypothetical protein
MFWKRPSIRRPFFISSGRDVLLFLFLETAARGRFGKYEKIMSGRFFTGAS